MTAHSMAFAAARMRVGECANTDALAAADALRARATALRAPIASADSLCVVSDTGAVDVAKRVSTGTARLVPASHVVGTCLVNDGRRDVSAVCAYCEQVEPLDLQKFETCACGAIVAHSACMVFTGNKLRHSCLDNEALSRLVATKLILSSPHFPFVLVADSEGVVRSVVSVIAALSVCDDPLVRPLMPGMKDECIDFAIQHAHLFRSTLLTASRALTGTHKAQHEWPPAPAARAAVDALRVTRFGGRGVCFMPSE
jgi:hypothetical protein